MPGLPGDSPLRDDLPVNRAFVDVAQDEPEIRAEPGYEGKLQAFSLFKYLSRSDVTWNPSVTSVCRESLFCPTTEEYILPIIHGNDRVDGSCSCRMRSSGMSAIKRPASRAPGC
jgi:hypothetical protein